MMFTSVFKRVVYIGGGGVVRSGAARCVVSRLHPALDRPVADAQHR